MIVVNKALNKSIKVRSIAWWGKCQDQSDWLGILRQRKAKKCTILEKNAVYFNKVSFSLYQWYKHKKSEWYISDIYHDINQSIYIISTLIRSQHQITTSWTSLLICNMLWYSNMILPLILYLQPLLSFCHARWCIIKWKPLH